MMYSAYTFFKFGKKQQKVVEAGGPATIQQTEQPSIGMTMTMIGHYILYWQCVHDHAWNILLVLHVL
jgi:hypothetical protein